MKREAEAICGISFIIKEILASSAMDARNRDSINLPLTSAQLGQIDSPTSPCFYARVDAGRAGEELRVRLDGCKATGSRGNVLLSPARQARQ